jgi:lysophospholipase L1-like esterase
MRLFNHFLLSLLFVLSSSVYALDVPDFNLPTNKWQLISLPANPPATLNTVKGVFSDDLSGAYGVDWILYEYDAERSAYNPLQESSQVQQGKGYWIIQLSGETKNLNMPSGSTHLSPEIPLVSSTGSVQWNLLGTPFAESKVLGSFLVKGSDVCTQGCGLDEAHQKQLVFNKVWAYEGQGYKEKGVTSIIEPWKGFWMPTLSGSISHTLSLVTRSSNKGEKLGARSVTPTPLNGEGRLFASPTGGGDACTEVMPCDIEVAFSKLKAGSVLFLRGGNYDLQKTLSIGTSGSEDKRIIVESYPGENAILNGNESAASILENNNVVREGIIVRGDYVSVRRLEVMNMGAHGVKILYHSHNIIEGNRIHDNFLSGITIYDGGAEPSDGPYHLGYNLIQDNIIYNNSDAEIGVEGFTCNDDESYLKQGRKEEYGYRWGDNADGVNIPSGTHNQVIHNTVYANSDDGIDLWLSNDSHAEFNLVYGNGKGKCGNGNGIKAGGNEKVDAPKNGLRGVVVHNIAYSNKKNGFDYNAGRNVTFKFNTSFKNGANGFRTADDTLTQYNIASDNIQSTTRRARHTGNSWSQNGLVSFVSVDPASGDFLRPKMGTVFEKMGAYAGVSQAGNAKIYLIGDSTVHNLSEGENGWGDTLGSYLNTPENLVNQARSGASSESFKINLDSTTHDWPDTKALLEAADKVHGAYLLIQFGHNDPDRSILKSNLKFYIDEAKAMGVTPVLITPVSRLWRYDRGHGDTPEIIKALGVDEQVIVLDLFGKSFAEFNQYASHEAVQSTFGFDDHTHFSPEGAAIVAGWVRDLACSVNDSRLCSQFSEH